MVCSWTIHNVTWYLYTYLDIEHPELYNWNLLERTYFGYLECSYITWYVHNDKLSIQTRTKVVRRRHVISHKCSLDAFYTNTRMHIDSVFMHMFTLYACAWMQSVGTYIYPMLRSDSRFWLDNNREIWSRISCLTSSAWDIDTKERHWWRHNGDSDRRPLSLPLRYDLVTLYLYGDLGQINVIAGILKLRKRFRMSQILFEHGINSLPLVCFRGYGNLSTLNIAIPRLAFGRAWFCNAACG